MSRFAVRLDRVPLLIMGAVVLIFAVLAANELVAGDRDGLVASLSPYFAILVAVAWAAPVTARELEMGTATWAWSLGRARRSWLIGRTAPMFAGAALGALLVGTLEWWTEQHWLPAMTQNGLESQRLAAAWPVEIGFATFAVGLGVVAAIVTGKVVPAIGISLITQVAIAWAAPAAALWLAPTRVRGAGNVPYVPNSEYWPVALSLATVLVLLGLALGAVALVRVGKFDA